MVDGIVLSTALIEMIEAIAGSDSQASASQILLKSLLSIFQMDQAALFTKDEREFQCALAIDRSGKILTDTQEIYSSRTFLERSLLVMEPLNIRLAQHDEATPTSIKDDLLKQVVCLPLTRTPNTAIFLGSQTLGGRNFSPEQMEQFKTAARAAWVAIRQFKTQESLERTQTELQSLRETKASLIYTSPCMAELVEEVSRIAPFNISVLLLGESGSGKEEIARLLHGKSKRPGKFVAVNCANLSESLLESELFGYRKGAFTGATQNREGLFLAANGGTLFLDELAELPPSLQAKLLRAVQEHKVRPVGSDSDIAVDVRIIAATHQDLESRIERGEFRSDLYYRVQEFTLRVPPLRERPMDIEVLSEHFVTRASLEMNLPRRTLSKSAVEKLAVYTWPGNVRELKNVCRTAVILARATEIKPDDLRLPVKASSLSTPSKSERPSSPVGVSEFVDKFSTQKSCLRDLTRKFEREIVQQLLMDGLSQGEIAARLDVSVRTLQRILNGNPISELETAPL
jgi:transcriptional regulator with GAF, ATPase, and Fis domain